jgi:ABC-type nickel/cobalt efflux system permease component RcnA
MSGGIAPCPAALVVLLAAIALNQVTYGLFVIVAFSFGLAATLTGLGIAVVRGASWLQGRPQFERFVHLGPLVSAVVIATIGAIMVGQGFAQQGVSISPLIVTAVTALAIAGYAFSHPFAHGTGTNAAAEAA